MASKTPTNPAANSDVSGVRAELVERAAALVPQLRASSEQAEREQRLSDETIAAMDEAGFFSLRSPARFGGLETDLRTYNDVVVEIAKGCGSAGWLAFISNAAAWVTSSVFGEQALEDVFSGNPGVRMVGSFAASGAGHPVDGGYVVTGRWAYASNSAHAQWAMLTVPLAGDSGEIEPQMMLVPMSEVTVEDTWHVAGMRGTGSNTVVADGVFVPDHRAIPAGYALSGQAQRNSPNQTAAQMENFVIDAVHMVGAPIVGMAKAALDLTLERLAASPKVVSFTFYTDARQAPSIQLNLARAATLIDTAAMQLEWWADETVAAAREGRELDLLTRTRFRAHFGFAMECCRDAIGLLLNVQGAGAFANSNPIQRVWRDLEVASRHGLASYEMGQEMYSRALLGLEQIGPLV
jgi:3-hydroxy-9,10-secoandrosta-1,3,5(10)-triene-9,17-dione monooxygenase